MNNSSVGNKKLRPSIIAFSGIDGAGKSTQIERLKQRLESEGQRVITIWFRGGYTPGIEAVKGFARRVLGKKAPPSGKSEQRENAFKN